MELTTLTKAIIDLRQTLEHVVPTITHREQTLTFATAILIATELPLNPEPVEDVRRYIVGNHIEEVFRIISTVNEVQPIQTRYVEELVVKLVSMRYFTFWPTQIDTGKEAKCFLGGFLGAHRYLSQDEVQFLNEHSVALFRLLPYIRTLINVK